MLFVAILAVLACTVASVPSRCVVGPWGEWSDCHGNQVCEAPPTPKSFPFTDRMKARGDGRKAMAKSMAMKKKAHNERETCKAQGTCPEEFAPKSTRARVTCEDGFAGEYPCQNVDLLAFVSLADLGYPEAEGNDIWVWHDTEQGDDYAVMGTTHGSSFVRITDPENPVVVGILRTHTSPSSWRDMKVIGNYAYIVSEAGGHGMQIFDLTQLRDQDSDPSREFQNTAHYDGVSNTHNIVANPASNTVFLVGSTGQNSPEHCNGGLHMVDVSNPMNPTFSGCFKQDGYVHDAECRFYNGGPDTEHEGKEICFCYNEDTFTIADVTDKANAIQISRTSYQGHAYTHQGWTTEDLRWALLDDELDEVTGDPNTKTFVWDISDLDNPELTSIFLSSETSIDHNLYIVGNYAHQSNYEAGYRLLELNTAAGTLEERAYFDVFPSRTSPQFYGTWSNYPWLDYNGETYVVLSSIDYGLYTLQPQWAAIEAAKARGEHYSEQSRFREAVYGVEGATCPPLVEKKRCAAKVC